jgi:glycosyltransferase involved in cell wall biosynthesis
MKESTTHTPKVSVIIPAYNAEKYLKRCLDSVAVQTMPDFEVIVVDDGSIDETAKIADSFAAKDSRFHIIHQENKGVSAARQSGLDNAKGEYTIHADSDDWVDPEMLESLVKCATENEADMVICDMLIVHPGSIIEYRRQQPKSLDHMSVLGEMLFDLHGSLCNKLIKRSRLQEFDIHFVPGMDLAEDQFIVLRLLAHDIKIAYVGKAFYHYDHTQNEASICNKGVLAKDRLFPLEMIADYTDITPIQYYFDRAVFHIAFEYLYEPAELCPDYSSVFRAHRTSLWRVKGYPLRSKFFVLLRAYGIHLPMNTIKKFGRKFFHRGKE